MLRGSQSAQLVETTLALLVQDLYKEVSVGLHNLDVHTLNVGMLDSEHLGVCLIAHQVSGGFI